jgi:hypothetical protein
MDDDLLITEPRPLGELPVAVHPQGLGQRQALLRPILVEPTTARHQLTTARRAFLEIATRMMPAAAFDPAVTAPIAARSPVGLVAEPNHVEATPVPMKGVDRARVGHSHLTEAPAADGHQATTLGSGLLAGHRGVQTERSSGNCG